MIVIAFNKESKIIDIVKAKNIERAKVFWFGRKLEVESTIEIDETKEDEGYRKFGIISLKPSKNINIAPPVLNSEYMRFYKNGNGNLTSSIRRFLDIKLGDYISIGTSNEDNNIYIIKDVERKGIKVRSNPPGSASFWRLIKTGQVKTGIDYKIEYFEEGEYKGVKIIIPKEITNE